MNKSIEVQVQRAGLGRIAEKVFAGDRLTAEDGLELYHNHDLTAIGQLANHVREKLHGNKAFYVRNQHINYTNICNKFCRFCSFYAKKGGPSPYTMDMDQVRQKVRAVLDRHVTEVHMVGGINPRLPFEYYLELLRTIKDERPSIHVKAFTMIELQQIQKVADLPMEETLRQLHEAGLDSIPGGGVEVLSERLHEELFGKKLDGDEWLATARTAHNVGLRSNATMLYGHLETVEERIEHMVKLRALQDDTGGFMTFIPLSFHPEHTELEACPVPTGIDDLRNIAIGRLMLDNFPHVKAFWIMCTIQVAQASLWYGADDIDGTIVEYEITRDAETDTKQELTREQLVNAIVDAGRTPVERDTLYNELEVEEREPVLV